ncbi:MAG: response regulator [Desulfobacterales bacterium]|nr:response regulator [Desulfobacterales bacterium]
MEERPAIYIVDDEYRMCHSLRSLLKQRGFEVEFTTSGTTALEGFNQKPYDLFLLDIGIPDLDGFQLMDAILERLPDAAIIMMTGDATVDTAVRALRRGAYDYLKKPFNPEELEKTVHNALDRQRLKRENRRIQRRLRLSENRYRFLVQKSPDLIYTLDSRGRFTFVNQAAESVFGYRIADLIGQPYQAILFDEDREKVRWHIRERRTGLRSTAGYEMRFKTGPQRTVQESGTDMIPVELNATGIYTRSNASPAYVGTYGVVRDISYRKMLETQLLHARKMEAIGNLSGGIAHDFNNLLMGIQGNVSLMQTDLEGDHPHLDRLQQIEQHVQAGAGLTRQLLGFVNGGAVEIKRLDINTIIRKQNRMFGRTHREISMKTRLVENVWAIKADTVQIEQVLLNLYINAWHAMPRGGVLKITTANVTLSEDDALRRSSQLLPGRYVAITVTDNGCGMDRQTLQKIFDPFFTTKPKGRGTGLGLATAYAIIKNHGGHISAQSREGHGSRFSILLPAKNGKVHPRNPLKPKSLVRGSEQILMIDDEGAVLQICRDNLKRLGYVVVTAESGEEGIQLYEERPYRFDLVILDMIMPGLSGADTYRRLKAINPDVKVLLATGYSEDGQAREILNEGCKGFIQKPFKLEQLSAIIRDLLDEACPGAGAATDHLT